MGRYCPTCNERFSLLPGKVRKRLKRSHGDNLYCSKKCYAVSMERHERKASRIKRRLWWTAEQWEWEKKLVSL